MVKKIYGMGNPLLDISCEVEPAVMAKYELKPANAILAEPKHLPLYQELASLPSVQFIPGGSTLNPIRIANWMLQSPGGCTFVGCIGKDAYGETMAKKCSGEGLSVPFMVTEKQPTGTCAVCITGKERSLVANLAAANCFEEAHMDTPAVAQAVQEAEIFYSAGFFLTVSVPSLLRVAKHAAETNKVFCLNLSAPFIVQFFGSQLEEVMPYVDILFSNDDEAREYGKSKALESSEISAIGKYIVGLPKVNSKRGRMAVITQGCKPAVVVTSEAVSEFGAEAIPKEKLVDTNGAGDSFVGGFLCELAQGKELAQCVKAGHYAAGVVIQHSGCTFPPKPDFHP